MDAAKFISLLFHAREYAHREHLRVSGPGSNAAHLALGSFYESIIDLADSLCEMYQGRNGIISEIPYLRNSFEPTIKPAVVLRKQMENLEKSRYEFVNKDDTPIQNKIDEIIGLYLQTLYRLENLE